MNAVIVEVSMSQVYSSGDIESDTYQLAHGVTISLRKCSKFFPDLYLSLTVWFYMYLFGLMLFDRDGRKFNIYRNAYTSQNCWDNDILEIIYSFTQYANFKVSTLICK